MKSLLVKFALAVSLLMPVMLTSQPVSADCAHPATSQEAIQCGANGASGSNCGSVDNCSKQAGTSLETTVKNILNVMSLLVGVLAVIMIIVGGLRYVTSGGKQESVSAAKSTLLYAVVGLVIVALSQLIVHFVLKSVTP